MNQLHRIEVTYGGTVTVDCLGIERETGPDGYRVYYRETQQGNAIIEKVERDETRPGKPENWMECRMHAPFYVELEKILTDQLEQEHRRLVDLYDEEQRRFG